MHHMNYPHRTVGSAANVTSRLKPTPWTARRSSVLPQSTNIPSRRFEALALLPDGSLAEISQRAPAHPIFEGAFAAIARGTIMATDQGPVAIEDLVPGVRIETRDDGFQPLLWIGTITLAPQQSAIQADARLFRIPAESFGPARPMPDLMLAPHARLLHRSPKLRTLVGDEAALTPIAAFEDGHSVIRVAPVSPVNVYHLAFRDHHILRANGLDIESFHPGDDLISRLGSDNLRLFQSLFPQIQRLSDFGALRAPRVSLTEFETLNAA
jgi:hypothetical protein